MGEFSKESLYLDGVVVGHDLDEPPHLLSINEPSVIHVEVPELFLEFPVHVLLQSLALSIIIKMHIFLHVRESDLLGSSPIEEELTVGFSSLLVFTFDGVVLDQSVHEPVVGHSLPVF